jgi:hypothetical protein
LDPQTPLRRKSKLQAAKNIKNSNWGRHQQEEEEEEETLKAWL